MKELEKRQDPFTSEWFIPKRRNQLYATRQNQIDCNNLNAYSKREEQRITNKVLNKNYNILKRILGNKKEFTVTTDILRGAQFDLKHFTQYSRTQDNFSQYHVFNYCLIFLGNNNYKIIKND
jgi:hypothetical protein